MKASTVVIAGRIPRKHLPAIERYLKKKKMDKSTLIKQAVLSLVLLGDDSQLIEIKGTVRT